MVQITPPMNAVLKSAQGIVIDVGYIIELNDYVSYQVYFATQVDISVSGIGTLGAEAEVTAVLINRWFQNGQFVNQQVVIKSLSLEQVYEDLVAFTVTLPGNYVAESVNPGPLITDCRPQIAVVVDGVWQQDPEQWPGAHNFNFAWRFDEKTLQPKPLHWL